MKKIIAIVALAVAAVFAVPAAAMAADAPYGSSGGSTSTNVVIVNINAPVTLNFNFDPTVFAGGTVIFSGNGPLTFSALHAVTSAPKAIAADGSVATKVSASAPGTYTVTATATAASGQTAVETSTFTVAAADTAAGNGLASTGYDAPMLLIWGAGGVVLLGIALIATRTAVRRGRATV